MIITEKQLSNTYDKYIPEKYKNLFNDDFIILDIETTGFSRDKSTIMLIGLIIKTNDNFIAKQFFCESLSEEKELLLTLKNLLSSMKNYFLITYNGYSFDIPFINTKLKKYSIDFQIPNVYNFDIYRLIRANKKFLNLEKYNLKSVEKFLKINRKDTISGKENIDLYYSYLKTKNEKTLNKILLHNYEDILYLLPILKILDFFNYNQIIKYFPKQINNTIYFKTIEKKHNFLIVSLFSKENLTINYYSEYCSITSENQHIIAKLSLHSLLIDNTTYQLINSNIIFNSDFNTLTATEKNSLIIAINNNLQYSNIILNLKLFFKMF